MSLEAIQDLLNKGNISIIKDKEKYKGKVFNVSGTFFVRKQQQAKIVNKPSKC